MQDLPSLAAMEAPWDVAEMAALQKTADDDLDLSHLEGDSVEELVVQNPVSVESVFLVSLRKLETFYTSVQVLRNIKNLGPLMLKSLS